MNAASPKTAYPRRRASFTLAELMVVMLVIALLASTVLFAMYNAVEDARAARTRAQIARLHELLMTRWESYRTHAVRVARNTNRATMAQARVDAIRELMRLEMPDRVTDVVNPAAYTPSALASVPALARKYYRRGSASTSTWASKPSYQGAECLYMIVSEMNDVNGRALDFFQEGEIGDVDGDGMPEILDAWGHPIEFVRWPYGFISGGLGLDKAWNTADDDPPLTQIMINDAKASPDPFDPLRVYGQHVALFPLVFSPGPDGKYDITTDIINTAGNRLDYGTLTPKNDPYHVPSGTNLYPLGTPWDADGDGEIGYVDNITNHTLGD